MIFTSLGKFIAYSIFGLGILSVLLGFGVSLSENGVSFLNETPMGNAGEAINIGLEAIAIGVFFGILAEISETVAHNNNSGP